MSRGVTPRFTTWCPEPATPLGPRQSGGRTLEYHVRLLEAYRGALERHGLQPPPGYGAAGAGNAVFSVSAFMDVLGTGETAGFPREPPSPDPFAPQEPLGAAPAMSVAAAEPGPQGVNR